MVSVVITAYNARKYVAEAVESVLNQTRPSGEVIVVDDGSTDDTAEVLGSFEGRIRYFHQVNQGQGSALNMGINLARGSFLAFIDSDDLWTPTKLEVQLAALETEPALDLVFGHTRQFLSPDLPPDVARTLACDDKLQPSPLISNMLARRAVFERIGLMKPDSVSTFTDWYLRMREAGVRYSYVDHHTTWRRIHTANTSLKHKQIGRTYLHVLKASLDRRRATAGEAKPLAGSP